MIDSDAWVASGGHDDRFAIAAISAGDSVVFTDRGDSDAAVQKMALWLSDRGLHALVIRKRLASRLRQFGADASQSARSPDLKEYSQLASIMVQQALGTRVDLSGQAWRSDITSWIALSGRHMDVFADGSRDHVRRFGAWAAVSEDGFPVYQFGRCASSMGAEFNAVMLAVRMLDMSEDSLVTIHTDSLSLVSTWASWTDRSCPKWMSARQREVFSELVVADDRISLAWVRGHSDSVGNRLVDVLSRAVCKNPAGRGRAFAHGWVADVDLLDDVQLTSLMASWLHGGVVR